MKRISVDQVLQLHQKMINSTGGVDGIRDINLLESALNNAFVTFDGIDLYQTTEEKCANICFNIINNHPFVDGNKRTGLFVMLILLQYNRIMLKFSQTDLVDLGLGIADGKLKQEDIVRWIDDHRSS